MKFGKNFSFWILIVIRVLQALLFADPSSPDGQAPPGERILRSILDEAVKQNEDDDNQGLADLEG